MVVSVRKMGSCCLLATEFQFCKMRSSGGYLHNHVNIHETIRLYTYKMVKVILKTTFRLQSPRNENFSAWPKIKIKMAFIRESSGCLGGLAG